MSISDLYSSGAHKRNIGHFADIVKLALSDGEIEESEKKLLDRLSNILDISKEEYSSILKDPNSFPTTSASSYEERMECLYYSTRMLLIDGRVSEYGVSLLTKIAVGLGFNAESADTVVEKAIKMFLRIPDLEEFTIEISKVNK
ncbi:TerB family tellurite resistance protein [Urechidicola croceus]|uniref:Fructose 1,6-bisphosphatase n=1 Tax=Urechidicola croceus TaxID=1850246 RepID=A0A1D8P9E6_9FLAO|nr:TerB family tellurite resistance protein [Urechidicola croceus]AOW21200.1 hypothetical protein LPB138_11135 [Urechidicola croceus]